MMQIGLALSLVLALLTPPALAGRMLLRDDGLHKPDWLKNSFKVLTEDIQEAAEEGRHLLLIVEQRGCIYCAQLHNQVLSDPRIDRMIRKHFDVVQVDLFGSTELTDIDGTVLTEKRAASKWGVTVTPMLVFMSPVPATEKDATGATIAVTPGVLKANDLLAVLEWVQTGGPTSSQNVRDILSRE
ncbi:DUF255 domain-containing protein [Paracoccus gahaiensis]|uniref:DUF255 domain-containing protein n=1 Tax=Paracoccus gahaiensis TaxID=1706839 RepID=A0A4U0R699_9RHOB|nr:thioredoxin family protein [Paracoccus gahaiensis]TJZ89910.1 DUF255 domain-containing protein [Paracoccus gahaiensis]